MIINIIHLILFSGAFVWMIIDLFRVKHKEYSKEYKELYVQNKVLLAFLFLSIAIMNAEKIWDF